MNELTLANVARALREHLDEALARQVTDQHRPDRGAYISPAWGVDDPSHVGTTRLLASCAYLALADDAVAGEAGGRTSGPDAATALDRATIAADYLLRAQRPSGLIDLRDVNYDSGPDTGFAVQQLCTVVELGRARAAVDPAWGALLAKVERFLRAAATGMLTGGFHTPNHRWVVASALAQAGALFPDLPVGPVIAAYVAEGFVVDAEGAYLERSVGVYDTVCDRSLLLLADHRDAPGARAAVAANLNFNLHLLHADGTAETGLSRRQDYGTRAVPLGLAAPLLHSAHHEPNAIFIRAAETLWERAPVSSLTGLDWLCYVLLKFGDPAPGPEGTPASLPEDFSRHFPLNGIWRVRRGPLSASFFQGGHRLLAFHYSRAELSSLQIAQSYFGAGQFVGDALDVEGGAATFRSEGRHRPGRPGYELPLGRPVPRERWAEAREERGHRPIPPATSTLTAREAPGGFDLRYRTLDGLDRVTTQLAFDFPPGGVWETDDVCLEPHAGQVLFLKRGTGTMRYGNDAIAIGPGADAHRMWRMRGAEAAPDHVRVLCTFVTPVDHAFSLRGYRGLGDSRTPR